MASLCVGAVVIGRNEGDRLRVCLESVLRYVDEAVYVDSGSVDGSAALAARVGAQTIELIPSIPFTAARARNVGWARVMELNPDTQLVQFVDGDCALDESWIGEAVAAFAAHPEAAIIFGQVRERWPNRNIYHQLAAMEWDTPTGLSKYCGGIAMVRCTALTQVGGFRDDLVAGEDPELCVRLRKAGWSILKLDGAMASHDCDTNSFRTWWKRAERSGRAYAEGAALHGAPPERHWVKETRSTWFWGLAIPLVGLLFAWPSHGISLAIMAATYLLLFARIVLGQVRSRQRSLGDASLYALACVVGKWPQAIGMLKYYSGRRAGVSTRLAMRGKPSPARQDLARGAEVIQQRDAS
jgi:GT2 family glycosyltransferase